MRKNRKNSDCKYPQLVEALRHEIIQRGGFWQGRGPMPANLKYVTRAETCAWLQAHGLGHSAVDSILREAIGIELRIRFLCHSIVQSARGPAIRIGCVVWLRK